jgi:F-type H+-transporting ATPase subunit c
MKKVLLTMVFVLSLVSFCFAAEEGTAETSSITKAAIALASGLAIGIAAIGGALGQGRSVSAGLEGIARNPEAYNRILTVLIIGLALIESLVIYALVISFMLILKL